MITTSPTKSSLDQKLERAQKQVIHGESSNFDASFLDRFFQEAIERNSIK